tara:strand:- start:161 stop:1642 length:1482 start_codon:yes stop_codon:yes gene_type:complete
MFKFNPYLPSNTTNTQQPFGSFGVRQASNSATRAIDSKPEFDLFCVTVNYSAFNLTNIEPLKQLIEDMPYARFFEENKDGKNRIEYLISVFNSSNMVAESNVLLKQIFNKAPPMILSGEKSIEAPQSAYPATSLSHQGEQTYQSFPPIRMTQGELEWVIGLYYQISQPLPYNNEAIKCWQENQEHYISAYQSKDLEESAKLCITGNYNLLKGKGLNFLEKICRDDFSPLIFKQMLTLIVRMHQSGWLTDFDYTNILLSESRFGQSLLHKLVLKDDHPTYPKIHVENFLTYLRLVDNVAKKGTLKTYVEHFKYANTNGYSVMHQVINAPSIEITRTFLAWLENECSLPKENKFELLTYVSETLSPNPRGAKREPRRSNDKEGFNEVFRAIQILKTKFSNSCFSFAVPSLNGLSTDFLFNPADLPVAYRSPNNSQHKRFSYAHCSPNNGDTFFGSTAVDNEMLWCEEIKGWHLSGNELTKKKDVKVERTLGIYPS